MQVKSSALLCVKLCETTVHEICPLKIMLGKFSILFLSLISCLDFPFLTFSFSLSLSFCVPCSPLIFLVLSFSFSFVEPASIMAKFSCYCCSCNRNLVCWLMFDSPTPIVGVDEVSGGVMVGGLYSLYY